MINNPTEITSKTLIYCTSIDAVSSVYSFSHVRESNPGYTTHSTVAVFDKNTAAMNKSHALYEFPKPDSVICGVVCTVAFGLGVNIPDIREVVNFGMPLCIGDFFQEIILNSTCHLF